MRSEMKYGDLQEGDVLQGFGGNWKITRLKKRGQWIDLTTENDKGEVRPRTYYYGDPIRLWRVVKKQEVPIAANPRP